MLAMWFCKPNIRKLEETKNVRALIKALRNKDENIRAGAATALGHIGDGRAVEPLIKAANDGVSAARYALNECECLSLDTVIYAFKSPVHSVRQWALDAVVKIGESAIPQLIQLLKEPEAHRWSDYVRDALVRFGGSGVPALIEALRDESRYVRKSAVLVLAMVTDERAKEPLLEILQDKDGLVRMFASFALCKIGDTNALERVIDVAISDLQHEDYLVRTYAKQVLEEIHNLKTTKPLKETLRNMVGKYLEAADIMTLKTNISMLTKDYPAKGESFGPGADIAKQQIPIICRNIDQALNALKTGLDPNGNPITKEQIGDGLAKLVDDTKRPGFSGLMSGVLSIEGVSKMEGYLNELKSLAGQLRQLAQQSPADEQRLKPPKMAAVFSSEEERDEKRAEWLDKAKKLKEEGQHEKAIEYWDLVIRANLDSNGWAHYLKGCTLAELDRPEEAAECLKDSLQFDPDQSSCLLELGRVFHKLGRWNEARSAFKKVLTMSSGVYGVDDKAMECLKKMDEEGH